ncbi:MAG: site-specific integrase [Candidatus Thiodiazotropha sp.]|nr:site-specific integrase [Candidatus Thiodiazotropha sp.]
MTKYGIQLHTLIPELELFNYYSHGYVTTKEGNNLPHICWPDGTPCLLANLYMIALRNRPGRGRSNGLSRRGSKGGTIGDYASKIGQLIRYCYKNRLDFIDLTDSTFTSFVVELRKETANFNPEAKKKEEDTITAVGRVCLDFLSVVGNFYGDSNFVSQEGTINATKKEHAIKVVKGGKQTKVIQKSYWHHHSLGEGGRKKKRNPIPADHIDLLRKAAHELDSSNFVKNRRQCLISLLEYTGARRGEVALIKVSDINDALIMDEPMLKIPTLKKGRDAFRFIPVTKMLLADLAKHIRFHRRKVIKGRIGAKNDHDFFFVSESRGTALSADTLTGEILLLKKHAGIKEQANPHMFRHTFCTNMFILLIKQHEFENPDKFRQMLIGSETFKAEVMQWTGHAGTATVDRYIHAAFSKEAKYEKAVSTVKLIRAQEFYDMKHARLLFELEGGQLTVPEYKAELTELKRMRDLDFETAKRRAIEES